MPRLLRDERTNRTHWDHDAEAYRRRHHRALTRDLRWGPCVPGERTLRILGDVRGKDVLEFGCGQGQGILHVKRRMGARRAAGVDLSPAQLAWARRDAAAAGVEVEFVEAPASDLSAFEDGAFDVAFSGQAVGFFPDLRPVFAECARVLRPGGLLAFSWTSPLWQIVEWRRDAVRVTTSYFDREVHRDPGNGCRPWTEFRRTYGDYLAALRGAGFELTDIVEPRPARQEGAWRDAYPVEVMRQVPGTTIWRAVRKDRSA